MVLLAPLLALGFACRLVGAGLAARRGEWSMAWGPRVSSWACFGVAAALMGMAGSLATVGAFGAFVVVDAATAFVKRGQRSPVAARRPFPLRRALVPTLVAGYLGAVAAFHLLVGRYFPYGALMTWTLLALGFSVLLYAGLRGLKAGEAWLRAPADHRRHERRETPVPDPHRQRAEEVLQAFQARGDAAPFLDLVRETARAADLGDADVAALEARIGASFARAGTRRDEDVRAALDEVERILTLRKHATGQVRP